MKFLSLPSRIAALGAIAMLAIAAAPVASNPVVEIEGAHRLGNAEADTRLTEFVSYTCIHCANFEKEAEGALKLIFVRSGKVSVEVRHIVRDPVDLTATLLARCGPADKFFANHTAAHVAVQHHG